MGVPQISILPGSYESDNGIGHSSPLRLSLFLAHILQAEVSGEMHPFHQSMQMQPAVPQSPPFRWTIPCAGQISAQAHDFQPECGARQGVRGMAARAAIIATASRATRSVREETSPFMGAIDTVRSSLRVLGVDRCSSPRATRHVPRKRDSYSFEADKQLPPRIWYAPRVKYSCKHLCGVGAGRALASLPLSPLNQCRASSDMTHVAW
jgi:hypothetical protein